MIRRYYGLVLAMVVSTGCGHAWTAIQQAKPNPLAQQRNFVVEPMQFDGVIVGKKPEADYLAGKKSETVAAWQTDKGTMSQQFIEGLASSAKGLQIAPSAGAPQPATFIIRPSCTFIEPGTFTVVMNRAASVRLKVQILDAGGNVIDVVTTTGSAASDLTNPAVGGRLRTASKVNGAVLADYLRGRTGITR